MQNCIVHVLPKSNHGTALTTEDMTARTTIAKLIAFPFVQNLSVRIQSLHNVHVLLLGTVPAKTFYAFLVLSSGFLNPRL
jgi:hypothetical protein